MSKIRIIIMMLVVTMLMAGCGTKQTQETKPSEVAKIGIVDMNKAVKAHPKYKQLIILTQQADAMAAQLEAEQLANAHQAQLEQSNLMAPTVSQNEIDELNRSAEQEDNMKLAAKERELNDKLTKKAKEIGQKLDEEMNGYNEELEKEYQPQIFNLQLKLKVVQLTKEESLALQTQLDDIQAKRSAALSVKHEQLSKRMNELMAAESEKLGQELDGYHKKIADERAQTVTEKQMEFLKRVNEQYKPVAAAESVTSKVPEKLAMKQQEIQVLQGFILDDITDKTAKVATAGGFEMVVAHVAVNVSAVDITSQVITECNK